VGAPGERGSGRPHRHTLDTLYEYDSYGNRTRETSYNVEGYYDGSFTADHPGAGEPGLPRADFDATYHSFPLTITNPLNQVERRTYDYCTGKLLTQTDPNNAKYVYIYDVFGRLKEVFSLTEADISPDATVKYEYGVSTVPLKVTTMHRKDDSGANPAQYLVRPAVFYDGLGRLVQGYTDDVGGHSLTNVRYDSKWNKAWDSIRRMVQGTVGFLSGEWNDTSKPRTQYTYDAAGRSSFVTNPDGTVKRTYYPGWLVNNVDDKWTPEVLHLRRLRPAAPDVGTARHLQRSL